LRKYKAVIGLAISIFLVYIAAQSVQSVWSFYTIQKFHWSDRTIGLSLAVVGVMIAGVQGGLIRVVLPKLGQERSIIIGLLLYTLGLVLFAFATESWMMFVFLIPYCMGGIAGPALQGYMSNHVPANEQGELQGGLTSLMSVSTIIGPLLMTWLFHYFTRPGASIQLPGAHFLVGAVLMLISAFLALRSFRAMAKG
jgi:DHA1 family tetracycline resistance protein-like MFS transporter